jgi:hypothetical protein
MNPYQKIVDGIIGPKGWTCKGVVGADGGVRMTISGPKAQAIELSIPNGQGPSVMIGCPYFASAQAISPCRDLTISPVIGESVKSLSSTEVLVTDPPLVQGNAQLSGGKYADESLVIWIPGYDLSGNAANGKVGYAVQADCAMPASDQNLCRAVLNFVSYWYVDPSLAGF